MCKHDKFELSSRNLIYNTLNINKSIYPVIHTAQFIKEKVGFLFLLFIFFLSEVTLG